MISDIMHIVAHEKGKPAVRRGRKTTGPGTGSGATEVSRDRKLITKQINCRREGDGLATCKGNHTATMAQLRRT